MVAFLCKKPCAQAKLIERLFLIKTKAIHLTGVAPGEG